MKALLSTLLFVISVAAAPASLDIARRGSLSTQMDGARFARSASNSEGDAVMPRFNVNPATGEPAAVTGRDQVDGKGSISATKRVISFPPSLGPPRPVSKGHPTGNNGINYNDKPMKPVNGFGWGNHGYGSQWG